MSCPGLDYAYICVTAMCLIIADDGIININYVLVFSRVAKVKTACWILRGIVVVLRLLLEDYIAAACVLLRMTRLLPAFGSCHLEK